MMIIAIIIVIVLFVLGGLLFYMTSKIKILKFRLDECSSYLNDLCKKVVDDYLKITNKKNINYEITSKSFDDFIKDLKEREDFDSKKFKKFKTEFNNIKIDEETIISLKKYYNKYADKYNKELNRRIIKYWYKLLKFKEVEKFKIKKVVNLEILKD